MTPIGFILGLAAGFVASTPLGPINLVVADNVLNGRRSQTFLSGVVLADVLIAIVMVSGITNWLSAWAANPWVSIGGGVLILAIGAGTLFPSSSNVLTFKGGGFVKGIGLCTLNPGFFLYWALVGQYIAANYATLSASGIGLFASGVVVGNIGWFALYLRLLKIGMDKMGNRIRLIRKGLALAILAFGTFTIVQTLVRWGQ